MNEYLIGLQEKFKLSIEECAEKLSLTVEEYTEILNSPKNVTPKLLKLMTEIFNVKMSELILGLDILYKKDLKIIKNAKLTSELEEKLSNQETSKDRLYMLRKADGLLQWEVAYALGMTRAGYNHYERQEGIQPTINKLHKISRLFNVSMDTFLRPENPLFRVDNRYMRLRVTKTINEVMESLSATDEKYRVQEGIYARQYKILSEALDEHCQTELDAVMSEFLIKNKPPESQEELQETAIKWIANRTKSTIESLYHAGVLTYEDILTLTFIGERKVYALDSRLYDASILDRVKIMRILSDKDEVEFQKENRESLKRLGNYDKNHSEISSSFALSVADNLNLSIDEVLGNPLLPMYFDDEYLMNRVHKAIGAVLRDGYRIQDMNFVKYAHLCTFIGKSKLQWSKELVNEAKPKW